MLSDRGHYLMLLNLLEHSRLNFLQLLVTLEKDLRLQNHQY